MTETIFALASAPGKAGVSVIRVSGPRCEDVLRLFSVAPVPERVASLRHLRDGDGALLDEALVIRFAEGASFTGEETVEFQTHGSVAVVRAILGRLDASGIARLAEPGEFTRRALLNDRLDMTEVQGLADVIDAETEVQRREAMRVLSGEMAARLSRWRDMVIRSAALLEATIDFADEEVPEDVSGEVLELLNALSGELREELAGVQAARSLRSGFDVAIIGAPNAGKSSLINYLTRSEVAIVSPVAGTTRDVIERALEIEGLRVNLLDTAGLRETDDQIEALGVERARQRANAADLRVFLYEGDAVPEFGVERRSDDIVARTKVDLSGGVGISTVTGAGIAGLLSGIGKTLTDRVAAAGFVSRQRDEVALAGALEALEEILHRGFGVPEELISADLRHIARVLQGLIGGVDVEAVLDEIFSSFCLGK